MACAGISLLPKTGAVTSRDVTRAKICRKAQSEAAEKATRLGMGLMDDAGEAGKEAGGEADDGVEHPRAEDDQGQGERE